MRVAFISDVHANLHALEAVLAHVEDQRVDKLFSLGDVVGYNAHPTECVRIVRERASLSLLGNHDWAATIGMPEGFNVVAKVAIDYTRRELDAESAKYLSGLSASGEFDFGPMKGHFYHGSHADPLWQYVFPAAAPDVFESLLADFADDTPRMVAFGHTHVPMVLASHELPASTLGDFQPSFPHDGRDAARTHPLVLFNPGSVGQPRDGDPRASYAIVDSADQSVRFHRVEYDVAAAARAIREAGLPGVLAERLAIGR